MEAKDRRHIQSGEAGVQIMDDYNSVWTGLDAWELKHTALVDIIELIKAKDILASTVNTGAARSKKDIRLDNGEKANEICGPLKTFLLSIPDKVQEGTVHFSKSQLTYGSEETLKNRWGKVVEVANLPANAAFFTGGYGVTHAMVTALSDGIAEFDVAIPLPKSKRSTKKAANKNLKKDFKIMAEIITDIKNLAQGKRSTNSDFVDALVDAFGIYNTGGRIQNAVFTFRDAETNVVLKKVKGTFTKGSHSFTQYSTKRGLITIKGKEQGNWSAEIEAETYVKQILHNIAFDPEKPILRMTIKLVKA
ncbi:MAG: hypothetical protein WCH34_05115 [Bacteroidota bacterium]